MFGLDDTIAALGTGDAFLLVIAVATLLGLRHATDPDHLTAVSTLIASGDERGARRAGILGLSWGAGHATTLIALGLPIVLFDSYLPTGIERTAEVGIGILIIALAIRLLIRWRRGHFHAHLHEHGTESHRHLHAHRQPDGSSTSHAHGHRAPTGRSPLQAYGIGLLHGVGGSAGVGLLLLAAIPSQMEGLVALLAFAACTAISMAVASTTLGLALARGPILRGFATAAPALGALSLAFGAWYALGAVGAVPYGL
jgi:ABC-type nickel/cobalt efflux system permease component RcnA